MKMKLGGPRLRLRLRPSLLVLGILAVVGVAVWATPYEWLSHRESGSIYHDLNTIPSRPVAIVFGAHVTKSGMLSSMLRGRVDAAIALYKAGKVEKLLMTGDNGSRGYDEVTPMKRYAVAHGVPADKIVRDFAGFHTFDSCYRARHVFDVTSAILVTQDYHLPRALYIADRVGLDAVGFVAPDNATPHEMNANRFREASADVKAVIDTDLLHAKPKFGGTVDPVIGDDRPER